MPADRSSRITSCSSGSSGIPDCNRHLALTLSASKMPKNWAALLSNRSISIRSVVVRGHGACTGRHIILGNVTRTSTHTQWHDSNNYWKLLLLEKRTLGETSHECNEVRNKNDKNDRKVVMIKLIMQYQTKKIKNPIKFGKIRPENKKIATECPSYTVNSSNATITKQHYLYYAFFLKWQYT